MSLHVVSYIAHNKASLVNQPYFMGKYAFSPLAHAHAKNLSGSRDYNKALHIYFTVTDFHYHCVKGVNILRWEDRECVCVCVCELTARGLRASVAE